MSTTTLPPLAAGQRITAADIAAALGFRKPATVLRMVREDGLPATKFGGRYFFDETAVRAWLAERGLIPETPAPASPAADRTVDPTWLTAQLAKFSADDLRRAGELLLALSRSDDSR